MTQRFLIFLFFMINGMLIMGCVKKPMIVSTTMPYSSHQRVQQKLMSKTVLHWRCSVTNQQQVWSSSSDSLFAAQTEARQSCAMHSSYGTVCRYKGCVQVESS